MVLFKKKKLDWVDKFYEKAIIDNQERIRDFIDSKMKTNRTYLRTYAGHKIYSNTYIFVVQFIGQPEFEIEMTEDDMNQISFCKVKMEELVDTIRNYFKIKAQKSNEYGFEEVNYDTYFNY